MHYSRWRAHGDPNSYYEKKKKAAAAKLEHAQANRYEDVRERRKGQRMFFIAQTVVDPPDECVIWPFELDTRGYGIVRFDHKSRGAHRVALEMYAGPPPRRHYVACHGECHMRSCINPLHLIWGSHTDNMNDRKRDGAHDSKISDDDVRYIRASGKNGVELSRQFGVSQSMITAIRRGDRRSNVI